MMMMKGNLWWINYNTCDGLFTLGTSDTLKVQGSAWLWPGCELRHAS